MMKRFKLSLVMLLSVLLTLAVGIFAACEKKDVTPVTYTLTFVTDGGTNIPPITAEAGAQITPPAAPEKEGADFGGWFLNSECTGSSVEIPTVMPAENRTYYAKWTTESSPLCVRFDANAPEGTTASGTMSPVYPQTATYTVPTNAFEVDDYRFFGWTLTAEGILEFNQNGNIQTGYTEGSTLTLTDDTTTLYAQWGKGYADTRGSGDMVYICENVVGFGAAVLVRDGQPDKLGFIERDMNNFIVGFTFYGEPDICGRFSANDEFVYQDDVEGVYVLYDYVTGAPLTKFLALNGYGSGTVSYITGDSLGTSAYGLYMYDAEYNDYLFLEIDPSTGNPIIDGTQDGEPVYRGFHFALEKGEIVVSETTFDGYYYVQGEESGSYLLYENGTLSATYRLDLSGYGTARLYSYDVDTQTETLRAEGTYMGTSHYEDYQGEWVFTATTTVGGWTMDSFMFVLTMVEGNEYLVPVFLIYDEVHAVTLNEANDSGATIELDGYGGMIYTLPGGAGSYEGLYTITSTGLNFYYYIEEDGYYEYGGIMLFVVDWAERTFEEDTSGFIIEDGVLTGYIGQSAIVNIPEDVTEIADNVFNYLYTDVSLISVVIPASVTKIGVRAFENNNTLARVTFLGTDPSAIDIDWSVENDPFRWPAGAFVIVVPETQKDAYKAAFSAAWVAAGRSADLYRIKGSEEINLLPEFEVDADGTLIAYNRPQGSEETDLTLTNGQTEYNGANIKITAVADDVFMGASWLTSIDLGDVTSIGSYAFYGCTALTNVTADDLEEIGAYAFADCELLGSEDAGVFELDAVTSIGAYAFSGCTSIVKLTVGANIQTIGEGAFFEIAVEEAHGIFYLEIAGGSTPPVLETSSSGIGTINPFTGNTIGYRIVLPDINYALKCYAAADWSSHASHFMLPAGDEAGDYLDGTTALTLNGRAEIATLGALWLYTISGKTITFYEHDRNSANGYVTYTGTYENDEIILTYGGTTYHFKKVGADHSVTFESEDGLYTLEIDDANELSPDTWTGTPAGSTIYNNITVKLNGQEVTLEQTGYSTKKIPSFTGSDGKLYSMTITLSATGNSFTYTLTALGGIEFPLENLTAPDGSTIEKLFLIGNSVYINATLKIDVDGNGKLMPSFTYQMVAERPSDYVFTFQRQYLNDKYNITITVSPDLKTFTYTYALAITVSFAMGECDGTPYAGTTATPAGKVTTVGSTITLPDAPVWEGYNFLGWLVAGESTPRAAGSEWTVTGALTITAQWEVDSSYEPDDPSEYTFTYVGEWTWGLGSNVETLTKIVIDTKHMTVTFTIDGVDYAPYSYEMEDGHIVFRDDEFSGEKLYLLLIGDKMEIYDDLSTDPMAEHYATFWKEGVTPEYTVTFYTDGGEFFIVTVKEGESLTLPDADDLVKDGYTFKGWKGENGTVYDAGHEYGTITADMTFTAEWEENKSPAESDWVEYTGSVTVEDSYQNEYTIVWLKIDVNGADLTVTFKLEGSDKVYTATGNSEHDDETYGLYYKLSGVAFTSVFDPSVYLKISTDYNTLTIYKGTANGDMWGTLSLDDGSGDDPDPTPSGDEYTGSVTVNSTMGGGSVTIVWMTVNVIDETSATFTYKLAGDDTEYTATGDGTSSEKNNGYYVKFGSGVTVPKAFIKVNGDELVFTASDDSGDVLGKLTKGSSGPIDPPADSDWVEYTGEVDVDPYGYYSMDGAIVWLRIDVNGADLTVTYKINGSKSTWTAEADASQNSDRYGRYYTLPDFGSRYSMPMLYFKISTDFNTLTIYSSNGDELGTLSRDGGGSGPVDPPIESDWVEYTGEVDVDPYGYYYMDGAIVWLRIDVNGADLTVTYKINGSKSTWTAEADASQNSDRYGRYYTLPDFGSRYSMPMLYFKISSDFNTLTIYSSNGDELGTLSRNDDSTDPEPPTGESRSIIFVHGSTAPDGAPDSFPDLASGDVGTTISIPEIEYSILHYTFKGWNVYKIENGDWALDSAFGLIQNGGSFTMPNYNIKLVSNFSKSNVTIKFDSNGGSGETMPDYTAKTYGSTVSVTVGRDTIYFECTYTGPNGAKFLYWSTTADGSVEVTNGFYLTEANGVTEDDILTLYAIWDTTSIPQPPTEDQSISDFVGKWDTELDAGNHTITVIAKAGEYGIVGYAVLDGKTFLTIYLEGGVLTACNTDDEYVTDYTFALDDGTFTLTEIGENTYHFTKKSDVPTTAASDFYGKWTRSSTQMALIEADGVAYYTVQGAIQKTAWMLVGEYLVFSYTGNNGYDYYYILTKAANGGLEGYFLAPDVTQVQTTFTANGFYTLMIDDEYVQFVTAGSKPKAVAEPTAPSGQKFAGWVLKDTDTPFDFDTEMTADASIEAKFVDDTLQPEDNTLTFTGEWKKGTKTLTKIVINADKQTVIFTINGKDDSPVGYTVTADNIIFWDYSFSGEKLYLYINGNSLEIGDWYYGDEDCIHYATFTRA